VAAPVMAPAVPQGPPVSQQEFSFPRVFARRFFRNKVAVFGAVMLVLLFTVSFLAPVLAPQAPEELVLRDRLKPPGHVNSQTGQVYWLGTDGYGRDMLSRLLHGAQISLRIGFISVAISLTLGTLVGAVSGYYGGFVDNALMRLVDILLCIPRLPLLLTTLAFIGNSIWLIMFVLGITAWMGTARLVRGEILSLKRREFVEAAHAMGARDARILVRHMLPNLLHVLIVTATFGVAGAMLTEAGLSYLGIGVQPPTPSWGNMLFDNQAYLRVAWWTCVWPGLSIFFAMLAFYFVGDGLRDALDPRMKDL
jgi:peptide/nickel transport system permease protein